MGFLDRFRDSDRYADVEKGRAEEVEIEDWQTECNMREYYNNQKSETPDCPDEDCGGNVVPYDTEQSRSVSETGGMDKGLQFSRESAAARGNPHEVYSCNNVYGCENHVPGEKAGQMQEQMHSGDAPSLEPDEKFKPSSEEMSQGSQNASELKSGDEEIEPPSNTETQN